MTGTITPPVLVDSGVDLVIRLVTFDTDFIKGVPMHVYQHVKACLFFEISFCI